jgi:UDP-N-acetylmuramoyl-tripeptide--D-alanyl-D-alanine ligase
MIREKGYTIIKDCYNAGPESMAAALRVLGAKKGRRIAVLGDMLELGARTPEEHHRVGTIAAKNADFLLSYGPTSGKMVEGAKACGMTQDNAMAFSDRDQLVQTLKALAMPGDTLLFKGSHGMHMEIALEKFLTT